MLAVLGLPNVVLATAVVAAISLVFWRRLLGLVKRTNSAWADTWLKAAVIVTFVTFFTVYVPSWVVQTSTVAELDRTMQDLIGAGVWLVAMGAVIQGLRYAHRERRV